MLLCLGLMAAGPLSYAVLLSASMATVFARGLPAVIELVAHGAIAALAAAAAVALWTESPAAPRLGALALVSTATAAIQSLFISWLPRNTAPGEKPVLAVVYGLGALFWLFMLRRLTRSSR